MRMFSAQAAAGMKVLLLDAETAGIVSLVCSQSAALAKEVYLFERIDAARREQMLHLKCLAFLRPTPENIAALSAELRDPKYSEYHLYFSNVIRKAALEELAQADEHEVVKTVQEYFGDYFAINPELFTLYTAGPAMCTSEPNWQRTLERTVDGLASVLLSMRKRPVIRYARGSDLAQRIASELMRRMQAESELFDIRRTDPAPLLLLLDRRDDPVTPLLFQWTYQAMVHELLGLVKNRVDLSTVRATLQQPAAAAATEGTSAQAQQKQKDDLKEAVLSADQDTFFRDAMFMDFGDLGAAIKDLVDQFQEKSKGNESIQSLDDIRKFLERYPDFRRMGASASKHVTIMSEISRQVDNRLMLELVGKFEQELACHSDHAGAFRQLSEMLQNPRLDKYDQLRLALLYALRYENEGRLSDVLDMLHHNTALTPDETAYIAKLLRYAGSRVRSGDLFGNRTILARVKTTVKRGIRGVQNVFTEHTPYMVEILDNLFRGKLKDAQFPAIPESLQPTTSPLPTSSSAAAASSSSGAAAATAVVPKVVDVIMFIVGGCTFEEALRVAEFNKNPPVPGARVLLGGTDILNSKIFLKHLDIFAESTMPSATSSFSSSSSTAIRPAGTRKTK